jgi:hypothetical protein
MSLRAFTLGTLPMQSHARPVNLRERLRWFRTVHGAVTSFLALDLAAGVQFGPVAPILLIGMVFDIA